MNLRINPINDFIDTLIEVQQCQALQLTSTECGGDKLYSC